MTREELLILLSRLGLKNQDIEQLREILLEQELGQNTGIEEISDIGFDITRTIINDDREPSYFENLRTNIIEEEGRIGRIKESKVWDCGHSQDYPMGGVDSFGHVVCKNCIRWCDRGNHPCCVLDSKLLRNGKRVCDYHRGLRRFFRPKFKREVEK